MQSNLYTKLQQSRVDLQKKELKKSGNNKFANFKYFELADFLSSVNEILLNNGLYSEFNLIKTVDENGVIEEKATLTIIDVETEKQRVFETPAVDVDVKGANSIQNLGSKHTYLKRYLYLNALEIAECDGVDATIGKETKADVTTAKTKATEKQVEIIKNLYNEEEIIKMLSNLKVKDLTEITVEQASKMIASRKGA